MSNETNELKKDVLFLVRRAARAGCISFCGKRETGVSSNNIVSIAYGYLNLRSQEFPSDESDLQACKNMWKKLPKHRKTLKARKAMKRAEQALKGEL
jgi:hypothetical protein